MEKLTNARKAGALHWNTIGVIVFAVLIVVLGWIEMARPLGIRFSDLTSGIVTMDTMVRVGILTTVVVGLNLLMGYAGQASLGQAAFYAMGAYASAILTVKIKTLGLPEGLSTAWWWPWLVMLGSMLLVGSFTYLVGKPILRLRGHYLAMGTLGLGIMAYIIFRENFGLSTADINITGGSDGIPDVGRLSIGGLSLWPIERYYFLVWAVALAAIVLSLNIVNSRVGRALRSIHGSEVAANTTGVDTDKYKLQVLVLSAVYASRHKYREYKGDKKAWLNYHWRVFRADAETAEIVISDWANDIEPGGPVGQTLMYNYISIQPYLDGL